MKRLWIRCPACQRLAALSADDADKRKRCGYCGTLFSVPDKECLAKAARILQTAAADVYVDTLGRIYG